MAVDFESELTLKDYLALAKRRWKVIALTFVVCLVAVVIAALLQRPVYKSEGFVAIESSVISKELVGQEVAGERASKYLDENIDKVNRVVFSRENAAKINKKYNLYPKETKPSLIVQKVRNNIKINNELKEVGSWQGKIDVGFSVEVTHENAETAFNLAKEVISQVLARNEKDRTLRVAETASFLTAELESLKVELDAVENKVAAYKSKHSNSLPEHQAMHLASLEDARNTIKELDLQYKAAQEELRYLDVEFTTANATLNNVDQEEAAVTDLEKARAELERSMVLYKEIHPTVRALKRKVALLEKKESIPEKSTKKKSNVASELAIAKINSQTEAAKSRLHNIAEDKRLTKRKVEELKKQVVNIPQVERGLASLLRDYDNVKRRYDDVKSKQVNAKIAESLELNNQSERYVLLESPELPIYKQNMSKAKMVLLGVPASLGLGFLLAFLLDMLDKRVRKQSVLMAIINAKPLAVIPYIETKKELDEKKKLIKTAYLSMALVSFIGVALFIINFFVVK